MSYRFLPKEFVVPHLAWGDYIIRPLTMDDAVKDFNCYMSCVDYLREGNFFQPPGMPWIDFPKHDMSLRDALVLLGAAEHAMNQGERIEYGVFSRDEDFEIGCVYLAPSIKKGVDAELTFWLRQDLADELEPSLQQHLKPWVLSAFPFIDTVLLPGREYSWAQWAAMPNG